MDFPQSKLNNSRKKNLIDQNQQIEQKIEDRRGIHIPYSQIIRSRLRRRRDFPFTFKKQSAVNNII